MVNVTHAFASGIGAGFLLSCLCVVRCDAGEFFAFFSVSIIFVQRRLVVACPMSTVCTFECSLFVVLALVGVMSSCAISAGLDFRHAGPGMMAELLAIEALLMAFHKGPHSEAPISSAKSRRLFLPCQNYLQHVCVVCQFCVVVPLCHLCGL